METKLVIKGDGSEGIALLRAFKEELKSVDKSVVSAAKANAKLSNENKKLEASVAKSNTQLKNKEVQLEKAKQQTDKLKASLSELKAENAQANSSTASLANTMKQLRNIMLGVAAVRFAAGIANQINEIGDAAVNINAKLTNATGSADGINDVFEELARQSRLVGTSIETNVDLFQRLTRATKELGTPQSQILQLTENINSAFVVSGASAQETRNAIIQLAQGFSAGALRGDEFRAVMEQAPALIDSLKDSLNVTQGELIDMAFAGELTSEKLVTAFTDMGDGIRKQVENIPLTTERAFENLRSSFIETARQGGIAADFNKVYAESIQFIADNLNKILAVAISSIITGGFLLLVKSLKAANEWFITAGNSAKFFSNTLKTIGIGVVIAGISYLIESSRQWKEELEGIEKAASELPDELQRSADVLVSISQLNAFGDVEGAINRANEELDKFSSNSDEIAVKSQQITNEIKELQDTLAAKSLASGLDEQTTAFFNGDIVDRIEVLKAQLSGLTTQYIETQKSAFEFYKSAAGEGVDLSIGNELLNFVYEFVEAGEIATQQQIAAAKANQQAEAQRTAAIASTKKEIEQLVKKNEALRLERIRVVEGVEAYQKMILAKIESRDITREQKDSLAELYKEQFKLNKEITDFQKQEKKRQKGAKVTNDLIKDWNKLMKEADKNGSAFTGTMEDVNDVVETFAEIGEGPFTGVFGAISEGLKEAVEDVLEMEEVTVDQTATLTEYLETMEREIAIAKAVGDAKQDLISEQELEQSGIDTTNKALADLIARYKELRKEMEELANGGGQGIFTQLTGVFDSVLGNIGGELSDTIGGLAQEFQNLFEGDPDGDNAGLFKGLAFASAGVSAYLSARDAGLDAGGGLLRAGQSILALIPGWGQAIAAVMEVVDQITGGKLFGTSFETTGGLANFSIGQDGASGFSETYQERQRSFFRGREFQTTVSDLDAESQAALDALFDSVTGLYRNSIEAVGGDVVGELQIVTGNFIQEFDKDGNLENEFSEVLGRTFYEGFDAFTQRLSAENILAGLSTVFGEVDQLANHFRGVASELLDFSQFMLIAGQDIQSGAGLFESLTAINTVIGDFNFQRPTESLVETYQRVSASTILLTQAFDRAGVVVEDTRINFVRFATSLTDAFGGIDEANNQLTAFIEGFFSGMEDIRRTTVSEMAAVKDGLVAIGLDANTTMEQFGVAFMAALPNLDPSDVAQWVRLGNSLNAATQSAEAFSASLLQQARSALALRNSLQASALDLFGAGDSLASINEQIALLESGATQVFDATSTGISNVATAGTNLFESWQDALFSMERFLDNLLIDPTVSPLSPQEQLNTALAQFDELAALAEGGDLDAYNELQGLITQILGLNNSVNASGQDNRDIFEYITGIAGAITAPDNIVEITPVVVTEPVDINPIQLEVSEELQALYDRRDEIEANNFEQQIFEFADTIRQYMDLTRLSLDDVMADLGVSAQDLFDGLNINFDELDGGMRESLATLANVLGIEFGELTSQVGIAAGVISDSNSILNDALGEAITRLPQQFQDELTPLFENLENATSPEAQEAALQALIESVGGLPVEWRDQLAPFFDDIDVTTESGQQLVLLEAQNDILGDIATALQDGITIGELLNPQDFGSGGTIDDPTVVVVPDPIDAVPPGGIGDNGGDSNPVPSAYQLTDLISKTAALTSKMDDVGDNTGGTESATNQVAIKLDILIAAFGELTNELRNS